jgi:hypothetical protein
MYLTDLAKVLKQAGLQVIEQPGWKDRGHGAMLDVRGVTVHHTASGRGTGATLGLSTVQNGRPGLDGPLAHLYLNRAGVFYVVAAGLSYHAGVSQKTDQTNSYRIGIEALAAGDGWAQDWPPAQIDALVRGCAALAAHYRFPVAQVLGHKETCAPKGRKIDPSFDMDAFRKRVSKPDPTKDEDSMELSDDIKLTETAAEAMSIPGYTKREEGDPLSVSYVLQWGGAGLYRVLGKVNTLGTAVATVASGVANLTSLVRSNQAATDAKLSEILSVLQNQAK